MDLSYFKEFAAVIESEIGVQSSASYDLLIQAIVSDGQNGEYVQSLPIKISGVFMKIGDNLVSSEDGREGVFDYSVTLSENSLFGPITVYPPEKSEDKIDISLGSADTIFTGFIDSMDVDYHYNLTSSLPVTQSYSDIIIEAILENPDKWTKTYVLVPPTRESGDFIISFPLDPLKFSEVFGTIQEETGISSINRYLTLKATVRTVAETNAGKIDQVFTQSIRTNLRDGLLIWDEDLMKTEVGHIEAERAVAEPNIILFVPVVWWRLIAIVMALASCSYLAFYF